MVDTAVSIPLIESTVLSYHHQKLETDGSLLDNFVQVSGFFFTESLG